MKIRPTAPIATGAYQPKNQNATTATREVTSIARARSTVPLRTSTLLLPAQGSACHPQVHAVVFTTVTLAAVVVRRKGDGLFIVEIYNDRIAVNVRASDLSLVVVGGHVWGFEVVRGRTVRLFNSSLGACYGKSRMGHFGLCRSFLFKIER